MKLNLFAALVATLFSIVAPATMAQENVLTPGEYKGKVTEVEGPRWSDFVLTIEKNKKTGTVMFYRAPEGCRGVAPVRVTSFAGRETALESSGEGTVRGCERFFKLTVEGDLLTGTLEGPLGKFSVTAKRAGP